MPNTINLYNATEIKRLSKQVAKLYDIPKRNGYYNISAAVIKALQVAITAAQTPGERELARERATRTAAQQEAKA